MVMSSTAYDQARLRKIAHFADGPEVLDIGYAQQPNPYLKAERRVGLDLNDANCDYEEMICGDALRLDQSLGGRRFDTIIAAEFIEHVENPYDFLRSLKPYLKPHGKVIISTPNPVAFPTVFLEWVRSHRFFYTSEHKYYIAPRWVERIIDQSGFDITAISGVGIWPFAFPSIAPSSLCYQVIYCFSPR